METEKKTKRNPLTILIVVLALIVLAEGIFLLANRKNTAPADPVAASCAPADNQNGSPADGQPSDGSNPDRSVTIVSKVSSALALIIESALPDFSLFLDLQRYDFYHIRANFSSLVFVCKSTTLLRSLFACVFFLLL